MTTVRAAADVPETVYVVIVNWNGWRDTLECLESVFRIRYPHYRVVVCDNGSSDRSLDHIRDWANGRVEAPVSDHPVLSRLVHPPVGKPIRHCLLTRAAAERGDATPSAGGDAPLVLTDTGANLGFAGACNIGLRFAVSQPDCGYVWLLNNDTVVDPGALCALVRRLRSRPDAGQCGSRLLNYNDTSLVQTLGGRRYDKWLGRVSPLGVGHAATPVDVASVEAGMSYVDGASLCVTRAFVEQIGFLDESYFLYYEELDWTARSRGRFALAYADDSLVYHKGGASTGYDRNGAARGATADFFLLRNRLRFTWRHAPEALPTVLLGVGVALFNRVRRGQLDRVPAVLRMVTSRDTYRAP